MLSFLPGPVRGLLCAFLFGINTFFWCSLIFPFAFLKLFPIEALRSLCTNAIVFIAQNWTDCNSLSLALVHKIDWDIQGPTRLTCEKSYLVCANHQSWVDIIILQHVFNRKIPFLRFFIKDSLKYIPFLGIAWWALDFPFMKRHSKEYLEKHPEKKGQDLKTTRLACERFKGRKISIINFLEGTRFTKIKHERQQSPYKNLLKPKAGGIAFVVEAMGEQFHSLLDCTIFYPQGVVDMWGLFSGQLPQVIFKFQETPLPQDFITSSYLEDSAHRERIQKWVHELWLKKDALLSELKKSK